MTTEQNPAPTSLMGPVRYDLHVFVPADGERDDGVDFTVNALSLPRVGDELTFESDDSVLVVKVMHVNHWFFSTRNEPPRRTISVTAHSYPKFDDLVRRLRKDTEIDQWISSFTMLER
ncbi:hypothetical protein ACQP0C_42060 (plasmid) [Nocardia sp. CA-129566]|uniref:hypothetical protein n=1 Tax=Nocardia sp. CA-129566 TaxID=3239976 RepID=UPI003D991034